MALERKFFFGFQTGGEEEFHAVVASGSIQTSPATWSDKEANYCYRLTWKQQLHAPVTYNGATARTTFSFHIRFENADQSQTSRFYESRDDAGILNWYLQVLGNFPGSFEIIDANGSSNGIKYNFFENDKWYRITVKYLTVNQQPLRVWAVPAEQRDNGTPVFSLSNFTSKAAGSTNIASNVLANSGWSAGIPAAIFIGSAYCFTETNLDIDTERILGAFVTLLFNDTDQDGTAQYGINLHLGRWDDTADVPVVDADMASYSALDIPIEGGVSADDGLNNGPIGQSDVDGRLLQRLGIWRAKKALGKGDNWDFDFVGKMGGDTTPTSDGTTSVSFGALGTSFAVFTHYQTPIDPRVEAGLYAQLGFGMENRTCSAGEGQCDLTNTLCQVSGMWMEMLHEEGRLAIIDGKSQIIGA